MKKSVILAILLILWVSAEMFLFMPAAEAKIGFGGIDCDSWGYRWRSGDWDKLECAWWRDKNFVLKRVWIRDLRIPIRLIINYTCSNNNEDCEASVFPAGLTVQLRRDGKDYTSILFTESSILFIKSEGGDFREYVFKSAILLVPKKEDVKIWQRWLYKQTEKARPRRVLPLE
ncbi:MAG: hypothetical protein AAB851_01040 [Patescibacteria group bacterium]